MQMQTARVTSHPLITDNYGVNDLLALCHQQKEHPFGLPAELSSQFTLNSEINQF